MKVATGFALPYGPGALWHGTEIPAGYARVGVDEILTGFHSMELDIYGPEGERTLGEVKGGIILWDKENIKFPAGSAPWTTAPPPSRRRSPSPPSPRRSPPPRLRPPQRESISIPSAGLGSVVFAAASAR